MPKTILVGPGILLSLLTSAGLLAQEEAAATAAASGLDPARLETLEWRSIGPFRGGRSCAVAGHADLRGTYFFGSCGGGVWKTEDGGDSWDNVSDGFFGGSIGAVAMAPSDPDIVWAGGGEKTVRGNVSHGDGIYKSVDGGETWQHMGLPESRHICRIRIHPDDPDVVYAACLGHLFGPNEERGVYRTDDGGETWKRILFANADAGAVDLVMDPDDPDTLFATTWRIRRTPWSLESGGEGSAIWKTTDGGETWKDLSTAKGLPEGPLGIMGVSISPADTDRVYAIVEAEEGGVFRSDNGGRSWRRTNDDRSLRQRAWYYTRIYADPVDRDRVYVLNVGFHRSDDGGESFETRLRPPHGDNHDLWIDPGDPDRMIEANDGGANVSEDGGSTWTEQDQATAQFYRVTTDDVYPYRIYGAQQDNSTVRIRSEGRFGITEDDWESTAGGESGHIAPHPDDPEIVYGGSYGGYLQRRNHRTGTSRSVNVWPDNPMGWGAAELKYRFQWNFPIFFSPHDSGVLYTAANVLFRSVDEGHSWQAISPDLTRNDKDKQGSSGGPITKDNTSVEYYCTIFAALECPHEPGVLWCGSDDGLVYVSRNAGETWSNVTPPAMPGWTMVNSLEASPHEKGTVYLAGTRYKLDDFEPYLFVTRDYGASWTRIDAGIDRSHFTRVIRCDPECEGLLYAGTERGVYVSVDDGRQWQPLELGLPVVPITDLAVKGGDLIAATQGRSFWVLDDLDHLRQVVADPASATVLYAPESRVRGSGGGGGRRRSAGTSGANPQGGLVARFFLAAPREDGVRVELIDASGGVLKEIDVEAEAGMNVATWNLTTESAEDFEGMVFWSGSLRGPQIPPGEYTVRLTVGEAVHEQPWTLSVDPRAEATEADLVAQYEFLSDIRDTLTEAHEAITRLRSIRADVEAMVGRAGDDEQFAQVVEKGEALIEGLTAVEEALYQTKNRSSQDPLNFPIRLTNKLAAVAGVAGRGDWAPTQGSREVAAELTASIRAELSRLSGLEGDDLQALNRLANESGVPHIGGTASSGAGDAAPTPSDRR